MTADKAVEVFRRYRVILDAWVASPADPKLKWFELSPEVANQHLAHMCEEGIRAIAACRFDQAMRLLGFVRGALWRAGVFSEAQMNEHDGARGE